MKKILKQYRQGDLLLTPAQIPATARKQKPEMRGIVLAEGEATGHCHAMAPEAVDLFMDGPQMYIRVKEPTALTHQEHAHPVVEPGEYIVSRQVEVWLDEVRQVRD